MRRALIAVVLMGAAICLAPPLLAQEVCPGYAIVINTPEDRLTLAYNGAENPQEQIQALDSFVQGHPDSQFVPCAHEYYTMTYLKLNDYDKVIEHGQKALELGLRDVMTSLNLAKAYVASGKVSDAAFDAIIGAAEPIRAESSPSRPSTLGDEEWKKELEAAAQQAADWRAYMEYAFFQLIQREPDGAKRVQHLDKFSEAYPDTSNTSQLSFQYYLAYKMSNQADKAFEYGEKAVAADPKNAPAVNLLAYDFAFIKNDADRASELAQKALEAAEAMKQPEGVAEEQFKNDQNNQLGMAHLTLGYAAYAKAAAVKSRRIGSAIDDLKAAGDLLAANPSLQAQALYLLGNAYEFQYPPDHRGAIDALAKAAEIASPWQSEAIDLLAKVRRAAGQ